GGGGRRAGWAGLLAAALLTGGGWVVGVAGPQEKYTVAEARAERRGREGDLERARADRLERDLLRAKARQEALTYAQRFAQAELARERRETARADELLASFPPEQRQWEGRFLRSQLRNAAPTRLPGTTLPVLALAFSPDGTRLAAGGGRDADRFRGEARGEVNVWGVPDGGARYSMRLGLPARDLAFSPGGDRLLTVTGALVAANRAGELQAWDGRTG